MLVVKIALQLISKNAYFAAINDFLALDGYTTNKELS